MAPMEARNTAAKLFPAKNGERRAYGKAPLELALDAAIDTVGKISQQGKTLPEAKLAAILGNTTTSSAFTRKIRALTAYGLLEENPGAQFNLTELAIAIAFPRSPQSQADARK